MEQKEYQRIEGKEITHIEIWKDCVRIHFPNKEIVDLVIDKKGGVFE